MFRFFKRSKEKSKDETIQMADLNGNILQVGDRVISYRYDLGECLIHKSEDGYIYESLNTCKKVSWLKMIDAATLNQKVKKID
jgi:predicted Mrr-cat superfamily restriction endonuclease